jgi:hypothetical protein
MRHESRTHRHEVGQGETATHRTPTSGTPNAAQPAAEALATVLVVKVKLACQLTFQETVDDRVQINLCRCVRHVVRLYEPLESLREREMLVVVSGEQAEEC